MVEIPNTDMNSLDPSSVYDTMVDADAIAHIKSLTGIEDEDQLKAHILDVRARACDVAPYPCIRNLHFLGRQISDHPAYAQVLELRSARNGALLLEMGCCFGVDMRMAVADGFPAKQIIASDLKAELWELGYSLCRDTVGSFLVTFVAGDALDPAFLSPLASDVEPQTPLDLACLRSLNSLKGKVSAIYAASFFHMFNGEQQCYLAHALGSLLSPKRGSIIFGSHILGIEKRTGAMMNACFNSPLGWEGLWCGSSPADHRNAEGHGDGDSRGSVFLPGEVKVETRVEHVKTKLGLEGYRMLWSVVRL